MIRCQLIMLSLCIIEVYSNNLRVLEGVVTCFPPCQRGGDCNLPTPRVLHLHQVTPVNKGYLYRCQSVFESPFP